MSNKFIQNLKVGVVTAEFNGEVTTKLKDGAINELLNLGLKQSQILSVDVPGAFELPLAVQWLMEKGLDGVIALGAVIRGETTHYDYVCSAVERGCSELQLRYNRPVVFGVLTTENEEQAFNRVGGEHGHKGVDAARTLMAMIQLKLKIETTPHNLGEKKWPTPTPSP